ncbi:hypothetical protein GCM10011594_01060 [Nakamurella endophytica]|uniref:RES domain-containing protein n=1 Tax=Nakamurella endophytica TaxID=1748367 RepID=A0A917SLG0_9ACTN|nr:hypothetical protein GCM10011594_01060 [Nakamurella endophytica]
MPRDDPDGRTVLYIGANLATSASEVFGEAGVAEVCPSFRVALLSPIRPLRFVDLAGEGSAMAIGALPMLGSGNVARRLSQDWARAIYEDQPLDHRADGVHYLSAYNNGPSLAVWDSQGKVRVGLPLVREGVDVPLDLPGMLVRLKEVLPVRGIPVRTINSSECRRCQQD